MQFLCARSISFIIYKLNCLFFRYYNGKNGGIEGGRFVNRPYNEMIIYAAGADIMSRER